MSKTNVVCITPLDHIPSVLNKLKEITNLTYEPEISAPELRSLLLSRKDITAIFTNPNKQNFMLNKKLLENTAVSLINTASTGLNHINKKDCESLGVKVLSLTKDYDLIRQLPSTSELAFGLALSMMRKIPQSFDDVKEGRWNYEPFVGRQLSGLTAGIIGYGRLGTFMARYCHSFGMKVLVNDPYKNVFDYEQVDKDTLYKESDLISLHVHVKDDTINMIDKSAISKMSKKPYIVNTSRGEIVNEKNISEFIKKGAISGYGTDVLVDEFSEDMSSNEIISLSRQGYNVVITPHIGGMSIEGQEKAFLYAASKFEEVK